jgi:hypothetical protein
MRLPAMKLPTMNLIVAIPLVFAAACSVETNPQNDQTTIRYDPSPVVNVAADVGNAAEESISDIDNATERAGRAIENVGDIDVDLDVRRDPPGNAT